MTEQIHVDDFLAHYGIPGMKWGKRNAPKLTIGRPSYRPRNGEAPAKSTKAPSSGKAEAVPKAKMSTKKKVAIAVGVGAVLAIGTAVAVSSMNKNMDVPIGSMLKSASTNKGKAAVAAIQKATAPKNGFAPGATSKSFAPNGISNAPRSTSSAGAGLTLGPRSSTPASSGTSTTLRPSASTSRSFAPSGGSGSPSLGTLSSLINSGPQVTYNAATGKYETK